jgi:hypothetical protein
MPVVVRGGNLTVVVDNYCKIVAANLDRLKKR